MQVESPQQQQSGLRAFGRLRSETALLPVSRQPHRSAKVFSLGNANSINRKRFSAVDTWASAHNADTCMRAMHCEKDAYVPGWRMRQLLTAQRAIPWHRLPFSDLILLVPCPATERANCFDPCLNCPETAIAQDPTIKRRAAQRGVTGDETHTRDAS